MTWPEAKLKFVTRFGYGDALPRDEVQDGPFQVFGSNGPYAAFTRPNTGGPAIVVGRKGSYGKINWTSEPCFASDTTFFVDSSTTRHHLRWIYWLLLTLHLDEGTDEAAIPGLNRETAYSKHVPVPPLPQQRAIANYLDNETARLDALIAAKERLLELMAEKRGSLITHAVTRGVSPHVPLRDSGILPWLRQIPEHWELKRAKWLFHERDERSSTGEEALLSLRMERGLVLHNDVSEKTTRSEELIGYKKVARNEIVINRMRAASGLIAVSPQDGLVSPDYAVFQSSPEVDYNYYTYLFKSQLLQAVFRSESTGLGTGSSGFLRLYSESFLGLWFPYPPLEEQRTIVAYIASETAKLDALRIATERTIKLLKERRAALIDSAVTGRIVLENAP
jgi:type I restriction enzyme S subunit